MADINAYLKKRRRRRGLYIEIAIVILVAAAALGFFWWLIFRAQIFRIDSIEIKKSDSLSDGEVRTYLEGRLMSSWWNRKLGINNFLVWPGELEEKDLADFPKAKAMVMDKGYWSHKLTVEVVERDRAGIWCAAKEQGKCFWFDGDGLIFADAPDIDGNLIVTVKDGSQANLAVGGKILPDKYIKNFFSIVDVLKKVQATGQIRLEDLALEEVSVSAENSPKLYFSLRFPADNTAAVVESLRSSSDFGKIQYIDFRIPNRAYYK